MPGNNKKTPITNTRKRVTASARARISTKKVRKESTSDNSGSYLQDPPVSTVTLNQPAPSTNSSNDQIMALLLKLDESNKALMAWMDNMEQRPSLNSTPVIPRSHNIEPQALNNHLSHNNLPTLHTQAVRFQDPGLGSDLNQKHHTINQGVDPLTYHTMTGQPLAVDQTSANQLPSQADASRQDAILPSVDVLRRIPTVADRVTSVLASYEQQSRQEAAQGEIAAAKKSGRYNTIDIVTVPPHLRWPNEGCHGTNGKKRPKYDELTLPQWVSGQQTNIYSMQDPVLVKQAILQMIMATRDAASLPWPAVRGAWAASMHEVEEGTLSWANTTQWSLNRLSASQIAMTNITTVPQGKRQCRYYNEGTCSHEGSHGNYSHTCSYCSKQGRQSAHPEAKCSFKARSFNKSNTVNH